MNNACASKAVEGAGANTETVKNNDMLKIILAFHYSLFIIHFSLSFP
jgi:hypothetical protein